MTSRRVRILRRCSLLALLLVAVTTFVLTHLPNSSFGALPQQLKPRFIIPADKLFHFGAYGLITACYCAATWIGRKPGWLETGLIWTSVLTYGAIEELTQEPFGRKAELTDWLADVVGVTMALVIMRLIWYFGPLTLRTIQGTAHDVELLDRIPLPLGFARRARPANSSATAGDNVRSSAA